MANPQYRRLSLLDEIESLTRDHRVPSFQPNALAGFASLAAILGLVHRTDLAGKLFAQDMEFDPDGTDLEAETVADALAELAAGTHFLRVSENGEDIDDAALFRANIGLGYASEAARRDLRSAIGARLNGYLFGLTLANGTDAEHDIDILPGIAASDDSSPALMRLVAGLTKRADASFAEGDAEGGMVSGESLPTSGTVHVWLIMKADGTVDSCFNNHASSGLSPTLPTGFVYKRRIGSLRTDGSANIRGFVQTGDEFMLKAPIQDSNTSGLGATASIFAVTAPAGLALEVIGTGFTNHANANSSIRVSAPLTDDVSLSSSSLTHNSPVAAVPSTFGLTRLRTNTSNQIRVRAVAASTTFQWNTLGWIDTRGRLF